MVHVEQRQSGRRKGRRARHLASGAALPDYATQLIAFHREFAPELDRALACLPVRAGQRVLDVACGDGWYSAWFAEKVGPAGAVTALDASSAWLAVAADTANTHRVKNVAFCQADARALPFADGSFDFVWCAQSFYSLPEIGQCLAEMVRVLRPNGTLAILEDDTLHHVLLPWPIDLEMELRQAEFAAFEDEAARPARFYVGRWLTRLLRKAGLRRVHERAVVSTRQAPLSRDANEYFEEYLAGVRRRAGPRLSRRARQRLNHLTDPASRRYWLRQPDFVAICLDRLVWGRRLPAD